MGVHLPLAEEDGHSRVVVGLLPGCLHGALTMNTI